MASEAAVNGAKGGADPRATWSFGGDHVMNATGKYPDRAKNAVRWFFFYCIDAGLSMDESAKAIRYDKTTVYRICKGEYKAKMDKVVKAIEKYRKLCESRVDIVKVPFVETATAKKIWKYCDLAITYNAIAAIYGDSHIGKTLALLQYAKEHNHGQTRYMRLSASSGTQLFMKDCATACALSRNSCFEKLRDRVFSATDENTLWIFDEIHQTFVSYHKKARISVLELIRELYDRTGCGVVLCGTNTAREEIEEGEDKKLLEQLNRRGIFKLQLPKYATRPDLNAIAKHFKLPPSEGEAATLVKEIIHKHGLKAYTTYLQAAVKVAANAKRKATWSDFIHAHDVIAKLSQQGS